jgi:hypothetical protein
LQGLGQSKRLANFFEGGFGMVLGQFLLLGLEGRFHFGKLRERFLGIEPRLFQLLHFQAELLEKLFDFRIGVLLVELLELFQLVGDARGLRCHHFIRDDVSNRLRRRGRQHADDHRDGRKRKSPPPGTGRLDGGHARRIDRSQVRRGVLDLKFAQRSA